MATRSELTRRGFLAHTLAGGLLAASGAAAPAPRPAKSGPTRGGRWHIGCFTRPWDQHDYRVALDAIAEAGFSHAGLMTTKSKSRLVISPTTSLEEAQRVGEEVRKRELLVPSVYGGSIPVAESVAAGVTALRKLIDNCAACGAETVMMGGIGDPKLYDRYYKAIAECCAYAARKKVQIILKPHGGLNATGPQCRKAVKQVGHENFRLWYDPGNIFYYSGGKLDPVTDAATVDGLVTGMCMKDYQHPKNVLLTPGTGLVKFPAVLARLRKGGFTKGHLVIETLARGSLAETLKEAKKARRFVEQLLT